MTSRARLTLIASLYVSQAIPLGLFIVALPAILRRQGLPLEQVGFLGALASPWLVKFAWAPFVDRYGSARRGHYRSWILPLQAASVICIGALALRDPADGLTLPLMIGALFMLLSATQDVATDGLAVRILGRGERGAANGVQVGGYYAGQVIGGGLVLVLYERFGWMPAVGAMAFVLAWPLVPVARLAEPVHAPRAARSGVDFAALRRFFRRRGAGTWVATLILFRAGDAMALMMLTPLLVDHGLSLDTVGWIVGVVVSLGALAGSLAGGALVERMGRRVSLATFGMLQAVAVLGYLLPAAGLVDARVLYPVVLFAACASGMATAALYTNMMDRSDPDTAATDFSLQQSLCALGPMIGATASGVSAARLGYSGHFLLCGLVTCAGAALVAWRLTERAGAPVFDLPPTEARA